MRPYISTLNLIEKQILLSNALEAHSNLLFRNSMLHTLYMEAKKLHKVSIVKIRVYLL